jgi:hypothetical protein
LIAAITFLVIGIIAISTRVQKRTDEIMSGNTCADVNKPVKRYIPVKAIVLSTSCPKSVDVRYRNSANRPAVHIFNFARIKEFVSSPQKKLKIEDPTIAGAALKTN